MTPRRSLLTRCLVIGLSLVGGYVAGWYSADRLWLARVGELLQEKDAREISQLIDLMSAARLGIVDKFLAYQESRVDKAIVTYLRDKPFEAVGSSQRTTLEKAKLYRSLVPTAGKEPDKVAGLLLQVPMPKLAKCEGPLRKLAEERRRIAPSESTPR